MPIFDLWLKLKLNPKTLNSKEILSKLCNLGQNICRHFHVLAQFLFTISETELDYYHQKMNCLTSCLTVIIQRHYPIPLYLMFPLYQIAFWSVPLRSITFCIPMETEMLLDRSDMFPVSIRRDTMLLDRSDTFPVSIWRDMIR